MKCSLHWHFLCLFYRVLMTDIFATNNYFRTCSIPNVKSTFVNNWRTVCLDYVIYNCVHFPHYFIFTITWLLLLSLAWCSVLKSSKDVIVGKACNICIVFDNMLRISLTYIKVTRMVKYLSCVCFTFLTFLSD